MKVPSFVLQQKSYISTSTLRLPRIFTAEDAHIHQISRLECPIYHPGTHFKILLVRFLGLTFHRIRAHCGPECNVLHYQVRSHMGAYAGAARRRVHLVTVLLRPPSVHRPGRCQARQAHIPHIGLRLATAMADARPVMPVSFR